MSPGAVEWRAERALAYLDEAKAIVGTAPLSARTAAYYASFHACHVALLNDERFDDAKALERIDIRLRQQHQEPLKHTGGPDRIGNVGLAWVLVKLRPDLSGHHDYLRIISATVRYEYLPSSSPLANADDCNHRAELVLRRVGLLAR